MKHLDKKTIHKGRIFDLTEQKLQTPDGKTVIWDIIEHPGAAAVVAVTPDGKIVMVRQYREGCKGQMLEIPAGKLEWGEDPAACALRELEEETGYRANKITPLTAVYPAAGYNTELISIFLATELVPGSQSLDENEFVTVEAYSLAELVGMIEEGVICDCKTMVGVLFYWRFAVSKCAPQFLEEK